jgi:hypothetical protein
MAFVNSDQARAPVSVAAATTEQKQAGLQLGED